MFLFRLALALGKTVAELEQTIGSGELTEWAAYYSIEPFGQWRDNWHMANLAAMLGNRWRKPSKPAVTVDDFMFKTAEQSKQQQTRKTLAALSAVAKKKV